MFFSNSARQLEVPLKGAETWMCVRVLAKVYSVNGKISKSNICASRKTCNVKLFI